MEHVANPVQPGERVAEIDLVRGLALLGIFIMNMPGFSLSFAAGADGTHLFTAGYDRFTEELREVFFSGKFNSMFSFLFAVGFTIQLGRLQASDPEHAHATYLRRLAILFVFGVIHSVVFWVGDVLHIYALLGLLVMAIHRLRTRTLAWLFAATLVLPSLVALALTPWRGEAQLTQAMHFMQATELADNRIYGHGTFLQGIAQNLEWLHIFYFHGVLDLWGSLSFYLQCFSTMLLGLIVGRNGWYRDIGRFAPQLRRLQWGALALGLVTAGLYFFGRLHPDPVHIRPYDYVAGASYRLCRISIAAFYVASLLRLSLRTGWRERLAPIARAGRMPLTNYLLQTLMATAIFRGWGLGWWGQAGPLAAMLLAIGLYAFVQLPLSTWWLGRYRYGPLEALWRAATYGRWPAMRPGNAPAVA